MTKIETIKYVSLRVYGKNFDNLEPEQQREILSRRNSAMALCNMVAEKNFQDLRKTGRIEL